MLSVCYISSASHHNLFIQSQLGCSLYILRNNALASRIFLPGNLIARTRCARPRCASAATSYGYSALPNRVLTLYRVVHILTSPVQYSSLDDPHQSTAMCLLPLPLPNAHSFEACRHGSSPRTNPATAIINEDARRDLGARIPRLPTAAFFLFHLPSGGGNGRPASTVPVQTIEHCGRDGWDRRTLKRGGMEDVRADSLLSV
ncbi:hypothetical protein B0H19DRAFT_1256575 [Mycena capillaripes]|nr:hypothetical protein B0H19DRAFT_1256575 [Mycena capillaripes]